MSDCAACGHPEVVHGGWARPDGSCGYQGCSCKGYTVDVPCPHDPTGTSPYACACEDG